jgi:hypothetical protein
MQIQELTISIVVCMAIHCDVIFRELKQKTKIMVMEETNVSG